MLWRHAHRILKRRPNPQLRAFASSSKSPRKRGRWVFVAGGLAAVFIGVKLRNRHKKKALQTSPFVKEVEKWIKTKSDSTVDEEPEWCQQFRDKIDREKNSQKRIFVLVNPASGLRKGLSYWNCAVRPVLEKCGIQDFTVQETQREGHATEIVRNLDLDKYDAIFVSSGDGTLCEVYDGLIARSDSSQALRTPVGVIPGGSGNAIHQMLSLQDSEPRPAEMYDYIDAALRIAEWKPIESNILEYRCFKNAKCTGNEDRQERDVGGGICILGTFLGMSGRFIVYSERLRWKWLNLGAMRYTLATFWILYRISGIPYEISYLPSDSEEPIPEYKDFYASKMKTIANEGQNRNWKSLQGNMPAIGLRISWNKSDPVKTKLSMGDDIVYLWTQEQVTARGVLKTVGKDSLIYTDPDNAIFDKTNLIKAKAISICPQSQPEKQFCVDGELRQSNDYEELRVKLLTCKAKLL